MIPSRQIYYALLYSRLRSFQLASPNVKPLTNVSRQGKSGLGPLHCASSVIEPLSPEWGLNRRKEPHFLTTIIQNLVSATRRWRQREQGEGYASLRWEMLKAGTKVLWVRRWHVVGCYCYFEGRAMGFSDGLVMGCGRKRTCYSCLLSCSTSAMVEVDPF